MFNLNVQDFTKVHTFDEVVLIETSEEAHNTEVHQKNELETCYSLTGCSSSSVADLVCCLWLRLHSDGVQDQRRDQAVGDGPQQGLSAGLPTHAAQPP